MGVAALVIGILGVVVFCWLGTVLGVVWAGALALHGTVVVWPIWVAGLIMGVGFPLVAVFLGIGSLIKKKDRGPAISGVVIGAVAALIGLAVTAFWASGATLVKDHVEEGIDQIEPAQKQQLQTGLQQLMQHAEEQQNQ